MKTITITSKGQKLQRAQNGAEVEYTLPGNELFYIALRRGEDNSGNYITRENQYIVLHYQDGTVAGRISDGSDVSFPTLHQAIDCLNSL